MESLLAVGLVVYGLLIGSFLNVVIARVPHGQSIVRPRSRCPKCGHQLSWFENIPVFSWLALRGKCRKCRAPISPRYVIVELLTGLLFLACLVRFGWGWELLSAVVLVTLLIPLTFIDLEHWILPFELTIPGIVLGVLLSIPLGKERLVDSAIGVVAGFLAFWLLEIVGRAVFKKEALGGGDKFLLALLGGFLGWQALLGIVFLSSMQGALIGGLLLAIRGRAGPAPAPEPTPKPAQKNEEEGDEEDDWVPGPTNIPFGPWLALAGLEILLIGPWLAERLPLGLGWMITGQLELGG